MTFVQFTTCNRKSALEYIQKIYPSHRIEDSPESAGPILDLVEKDIVRIQDLMMYGSQIQIIPGTNWVEDESERSKVVDICQKLINPPTKEN